MSDYDKIIDDLSVLHKAASRLDGWDKHFAQDFIDEGEICLALDSIAYAYLINNEKMPADLFDIFEGLAVRTKVGEDPEYDAVARLRATAKAQ